MTHTVESPTRCPAIQPGTHAACCIAVHGPDTPHAWDDGDAWPGYAMQASRRCCCPSSDAATCVEIRYHAEDGHDEPCECACHEPEDDDDDDR